MNKKRHIFFFSFLVAIYTITSIGIPVYYHYCGGELEKVSAVIQAKSCCGSEDEQDNCCKNEVKHLSLHTEFSQAVALKPAFDMAPLTLYILPFFDLYLKQQNPSGDCQLYFHDNAHPPDPLSVILVKTSVFRI